MGKNRGDAAAQLVDLVKSIVRDEESKRDQVIVGTVLTRNDSDDTYDVYVDTDASVVGRPALMKGIPNESKHIYSRGDHVYVLKVRGQISQGFIIGSVGTAGVSLNARVEDIAKELSLLRSVVGPSRQTTSPNMTVTPFPYTMEYGTVDIDVFAFELSWNGDCIPSLSSHIYSELRIGGESYPNGDMAIEFFQNVNATPSDPTNLRIVKANNIFASSDSTKVAIVGADIRPGNTRQRLRIAFANDGNPIQYSDVEVIKVFADAANGMTVINRNYRPVYATNNS